MTAPLPRGALAAPVHPPPGPRPARLPLMRKVEVACLLPDGREAEVGRLVPALPAFEQAFAGFARGTVLASDRGPVAVEDLWPGDRLKVAPHRWETLLWRGSTMVVPDGARGLQDPAMTRLTRVAADALGIARPAQDVLLGPHGRVAHRGPGVRALTGRDAAFVPAADLVDGEGVAAVAPQAPVQVFHLGLAGHERLLAAGLEVESCHPGPLHALGLRGELLDLYLSCFPHLADLGGFGPPDLPRLRLRDLDLFDVA